VATLTIQIVTGAGTTSASKTFSAADAQRILAAYQRKISPGGTQQTLNDYLMTLAVNFLGGTTAQSEASSPAPPTFT